MKIAIILGAILGATTLYGQADMAQPFRDCGIGGSITLFDYKANQWISNDMHDSQSGTLPASTFKIINTLIALDVGVIADENEIIPWPGTTDTVKYGYRPEIYHDISLREAFRLSAGWAYVELAKKIGKDRYQEYLKNLNYGNADVSINDPDFWNFGNLAISPVNQIEILRGVYEESLPFSKRAFGILKEMMIEEKTDTYTLRAKTGWTRQGGKDTGWWVGYVERSDNVYFFATRLIKDRATPNPNFGICRKTITRTILQQMKMIE